MKETTVNTLLKGVGLFGLVALLIAIIALGPFVVIWAMNTLVPVAAIPYGFWQWLAVIVLGLFFRDGQVKK